MRLLENRAIQRADAIVVISEHLKSELLSRGIANNAYVVPNGVDTTKFTSREKSKRLLENFHLGDKIVMGYIGTLSADYEGLEYLIEALPLIIKKHPHVVLLLVGDSALKQTLEELSKKLRVKDNVVFTGRIPHDIISEYYSIIDFFILPRKGTRETELVTALKPLEAIANGKPVIGINFGGLQELIAAGETGLLFEAKNVKDLADKCINLIENTGIT